MSNLIGILTPVLIAAPHQSNKIKWAQKETLDVTIKMNSISASKFLKKHGSLVGKSVICDIKKRK